MTTKFLLVLLALLVIMAQPVLACPSCAEAPQASSGSEEEEQNINNPEAYNHSIYILVGVPYFVLAVLGILVYRGVKKNEEFLRTRQ
jgi:hypothetical protein